MKNTLPLALLAAGLALILTACTGVANEEGTGGSSAPSTIETVEASPPLEERKVIWTEPSATETVRRNIPGDKKIIWEHKFGDVFRDVANDTVELPNGSLITVGLLTFPNNKSYNGFIKKIDSEGKVEWALRADQDESLSGVINIRSVNILKQGDIIVAGIIETEDGTIRPWLSRLDQGGEIIWSIASDIIEGGSFLTVDISDSNDIITGGVKYNAGLYSNAFIAVFDSNGNEVWKVIEGKKRANEYTKVLMHPDGSFLAGGRIYKDLDNRLNVQVEKYSIDGNLIWNFNFGKLRYDDFYLFDIDSEFYSLDVDRQGNIFVIGQSEIDPNDRSRKYFLMMISGEGELMWTKEITELDPSKIKSISDNELILVGKTLPLEKIKGVRIERWSKAGEFIDYELIPEYVSETEGLSLISISEAYDVEIIGDGSLLITGANYKEYSEVRSQAWIHKRSF